MPKEIIIHDHDWLEYDSFIKQNFNPEQRLGWCNGVIYSIAHPPHVDEITLEFLRKGIKHFSAVDCADMPEFQEYITNGENFKMKVIDYSDTPLIVEMIEYLRGLKNAGN
jgi:hypothetical protein